MTNPPLSSQKASLERLFNPESIAIVGASPVEGKLGRAVVDSMIAHGYSSERLFLVNPSCVENEKEETGKRYYRNVADIPEIPDLSVILIPAQRVLEATKECFEKGIRKLIVMSAGFSETGSESGREIEKELLSLAKEYDARIVGPNCLGIFDNVSRVDTFFVPPSLIHRPQRGAVSIASQSGSFVGHFLDICYSEKLGIARAITYGNRVDVDESDVLEYFAQDGATRVIGLYVEGVSSGPKFLKALEKCSESRKQVVALKTGKYASLEGAVTSHTGALAGSYQAYRAVFKKFGVLEVDGIEKFIDACKALTMLPRAKGKRILILGHAGGLGLTLADNCISLGLLVPQIPLDLKEILGPDLLSFASLSNPVDLTASGTDEQAELVLGKCLTEPFFDMAIYLALWGLPQNTEKIGGIVARTIAKSSKPVIVASLATQSCIERGHVFEDLGVPVFFSLERAAFAAHCLARPKDSDQKLECK
ncbi:MAG TPA: CoA-binding protein [Nitrososphaerales archaeon]|nr:CoA-binding protein [Nitrososphaerales archaeon]